MITPRSSFGRTSLIPSGSALWDIPLPSIPSLASSLFRVSLPVSTFLGKVIRYEGENAGSWGHTAGYVPEK